MDDDFLQAMEHMTPTDELRAKMLTKSSSATVLIPSEEKKYSYEKSPQKLKTSDFRNLLKKIGALERKNSKSFRPGPSPTKKGSKQISPVKKSSRETSPIEKHKKANRETSPVDKNKKNCNSLFH